MKVFPKRLPLLVIVFIGLIAGILCNDKIEVPAGVTELNDDNFGSFIESNSVVLVIFYDFSGMSRRIIQGLGEVVSGIEKEKGNGKIALVKYADSATAQKLFIRSSPFLAFFYGSMDKYQEYPRHLTGLERQSMVSIILSKEDTLFVEYDSSSVESLEEAKKEFDLEGKISQSNIPVLVYYGKPGTKRTEIVKSTIKRLRESGIAVKSLIIYVKFKADIALHIYRLPEPDRQGRETVNPKELYVAKKRILGLLEWNEQILSVFVESCIRPYVSFKGNELMYIHKSSNSLITYIKGSDTQDMYGSSNIKYLDDESMESLRAVAKANFFPEDPDKDLMVGLVLPGLEQNVESLTGFLRSDHGEKGTFLLKLRTSKSNQEGNSGESEKFFLSEEDVKKHGLSNLISQARRGNIPVFYKSKRVLDSRKVSTSVDQYFTSPFYFLELTPPIFTELLKDRNASILVMFYTEMCSKCKDILPLWESVSSRVASSLTKDSKFRSFIAVFDLELNDNPIDMDISSIPVIYYFPFGDNKVSNKVVFTDNLTLDIISTFIEDKISQVSEAITNEEGNHQESADQSNASTSSPQPHVKDEL